MTIAQRIAQLSTPRLWGPDQDHDLVRIIGRGGSIRDAADATDHGEQTVADRWFSLCRAVAGNPILKPEEFAALEAAVRERLIAH